MTWLKPVVGLIVVALVVRYLYSNVEKLEGLYRVRVEHFSALVGLTLLINLVYGDKVLFLFRRLGLTGITYLQWFRIFLTARFLNLHLVQGAMVYRSVQLKRRFNFSYSRSVGQSVFLSWLEFLNVLGLAGIVVLVQAPQILVGPVPVPWVLASCFVGTLFAPALLRGPLLWLTGRDGAGVKGRVGRLLEETYRGGADRGLVARMTASNTATVALQIVWTHTALTALGQPSTLSTASLYVVVLQLVGSVRLVPGNLGVTETALGLLAVALGEDFGGGVMLSLLQRIVVYMFFATVALPLWFSGRTARE